LADTALNETAISNTASRGKKRSVAELADRQEKRAPAMAASVKTAAEPSPPSDTTDLAQEPLHHVASDNAIHAAKSETQNPSSTIETASDPLGFDANESAQNNLATPSSDQTLTTSTIADTLNGKADDKPHAEDLPPSVTIESVTLRSGGHEHDTDASAPSPSADQAVQESHIPIALSPSDAHPAYTSDSGYRSNASTSQLDYSPIATTPQASSTHVDNPAFVAQRQRAFEQQIMSALRNGGSEVRAMLYPPQLGQVTINLILDGNKVRLSAKTSSRDATNTLMSEKPSLASALDDEGFVLTGFDVRDDASNNSSSDDPSSSSPIETIHTPKPSASRADASFSLDITI
jgi:flagellar hook-length control protein FliK